MHTAQTPLIVGGGGFLAVLTVEQFNVYAGAVIAVLTVAALIPLVVVRWRKFLTKSKDTNAPF